MNFSLYTVAAVVLTISLVSAPLVFGQETASGSFRSVNPATDSYGGTASSTGFSSVISGGQSFTGEATSSSFTLRTGFLYFDSFTPKSQQWRWYDDEINETPTTPLATENTAPAGVEIGEIVKLRVTVAETADIGAVNTKFRLQYSTSSDFSENVHFVHDISECNGTRAWCYEYGAGDDGVKITTAVLSDADACVASVGDGCGTHNESGTSTSVVTHSKSATAEYEFTLKESQAASANTVYFFRLLDMNSSSTVPYNTGKSYPSIVTGGTQLSFSINGLEIATSTEGVITDVETTANTIPFGLLTLGSITQAAQRLMVSTNAGSGYKIFAYQRQDFLNGLGDPISPVNTTNSAPAGWSSACPGGPTSCYGYHTGKDVLDGGSARFAPNDSYASFSGSPEEISYNSGPATNDVTDMVYQVEVRPGQDTGEYTTTLVYIVVPVF